MKKIILLLSFALLSLSGFAQLSKADAKSFLERNPVGNLKNIFIWGEYGNNDGVVGPTYSRYEAVTASLEAMDSGFLLSTLDQGKKSETFIPYLHISEIFANTEWISISINK